MSYLTSTTNLHKALFLWHNTIITFSRELS